MQVQIQGFNTGVVETRIGQLRFEGGYPSQ